MDSLFFNPHFLKFVIDPLIRINFEDCSKFFNFECAINLIAFVWDEILGIMILHQGMIDHTRTYLTTCTRTFQPDEYSFDVV